METLITISNFIVLGFILLSPILILFIEKRCKIKRTLMIYSLTSLFILGLFIYFLAWWNDKATLILLEYYGYNIDGMNDFERYGSVLPKNAEQVKTLETSIMGIGWQFKAIFGFVIFIPYLIFVYFVKIAINKIKTKKTNR